MCSAIALINSGGTQFPIRAIAPAEIVRGLVGFGVSSPNCELMAMTMAARSRTDTPRARFLPDNVDAQQGLSLP